MSECVRCGNRGAHAGLGGCGGCGRTEPSESQRPEHDRGYVAGLMKLAEDRGWDPRVFPSVAMSNSDCYVCGKPGPRYCCWTCPEDEVAPGVQSRRCGDCHAKHFDAVHDIELPRKQCFTCKKDLGHSPEYVTAAGAPRCLPGECGPAAWWLQ